MRLGLIADIHADYGALMRALDVLQERGAEKVVCLGDMVEKGPEGDRVIEALREQLVVCVRGNHDDNAVRRFHEGDEDAGEPILAAESIAFLEALPVERACRWGGLRVLLTHTAPGSPEEHVLPGQIPRKLKRALRALDADVLMLGHTHRPMKVRHGPIWLLNPGSVAGTRTRDSFTCAVVDLPSLAMEVLSLDTGAPISFACAPEEEPPED
ncbi:Serine/threonine protein phosphatase [Minicystis rosea]|nr:Serine/threonine protein phosphatase [Minicystis rosea]